MKVLELMQSWRLRTEEWTGVESIMSLHHLFLPPSLTPSLSSFIILCGGGMYAHAYTWIFMCEHPYACSCTGQRLTLNAFFMALSVYIIFFSYWVSHWVWNLPVWLDWSASEFQGSAYLSLLHAILRTQASLFVPRFFCLMYTTGSWTQVFKFIQ